IYAAIRRDASPHLVRTRHAASGSASLYTDDPAVTERGKFHFEFFNEFDTLQTPQFPNLRQNTANYKLNYSQQLGSGLTDYWLTFIVQKSLPGKNRINGNAGYLFAGNTSTGVLGLTKVRGHVFPGGLSLLHDFTPRLTLGAEVFGGFSNNDNLGR